MVQKKATENHEDDDDDVNIINQRSIRISSSHFRLDITSHKKVSIDRIEFIHKLNFNVDM